MANKLEQIAEKQKQKTIAKQQDDVARFSSQVASEVVGAIGDLSLSESVAELAAHVAQAVVLSSANLDANLKDSFSQLLLAIRDNKPDDSSQIDLSLKIGETLAKLEATFDSLELSPTINLEAITADELRVEVAKILARLPEDSQRIVSIAYENASPEKYLNVRLTNGRGFYNATGGIGGATNGLTDSQLRASPVPVSATFDTTGLATETKQDTLIGLVDGIETLIGLTNTALATLNAAQKTEWIINDQEETDTYKYYGFESPAGTWKISRKTLADNSWRYATGSSDYATAWTNRASQTYDTAGATF